MENEKQKVHPVDSIIIEKADNGFILRTVELLEDDYAKESAIVIEGDDERHEATTKLLEAVAEWAGYSYDKFGKENLSIRWNKKGHKI